jgi:16S rRNA (uracil1498-N3)-methyltransferase
VGPEGGFTEAEVAAARAAGVPAASLGGCALRTEIAAAAAAAVALAQG